MSSSLRDDHLAIAPWGRLTHRANNTHLLRTVQFVVYSVTCSFVLLIPIPLALVLMPVLLQLYLNWCQTVRCLLSYCNHSSKTFVLQCTISMCNSILLKVFSEKWVCLYVCICLFFHTLHQSSKISYTTYMGCSMTWHFQWWYLSQPQSCKEYVRMK